MTSGGPSLVHYSCKCLNVNIRTGLAPGPPPPGTTDDTSPEYLHVYVGDHGITTTHPQLTLRVRTRGVAIPGTTRCSRYTSLTCLICQQGTVYRVHQLVSLNTEGRDGPLLPTDEWVEQEVLKSTSGWVEVHKDCMTNEAIDRAKSSSSYSDIFGLVLPSSPPSSPEPVVERLPSQSPRPSSPSSPNPHFLHLRPLFPPPPFTPANPTFVHLADLAIRRSQQLRSAAEESIAEMIRQQVAEIERAEVALKRDVEVLWKRFRQGVRNIEEQNTRHSVRSPDSRREHDARSGRSGSRSPSRAGTPMAVRDFVPLQLPIVREVPAASVPRVSTLSASLATTSFHHPRGREEQASSGDAETPGELGTRRPSYVPPASSPGSGSNRPLSPPSGASVPQRPPTDGSNVLQFKRITDDTLNTAASYRYFTDLEADIARYAMERKKESGDKPQAEGSHTNGRIEARGEEASTNGDKRPAKARTASEPNTNDGQQRDASGSQELENGKKGKRKVTFDVKPAVVTITREVNAEKEEEAALASQDTGEMIFELEDPSSERATTEVPSPTLPLLEQPASPRPSRARQTRSPRNLGLPGTFSNLRPASLPAPSHIRPPRNHQGADSSSHIIHFQPAPKAVTTEVDPPKPTKPDPEPVKEVEADLPLDLREEEILRLVAANTPSHRGAWTRDSPAWKTFVRRQDSKEYESSDPIFEEAEGDDDLDGDNNRDEHLRTVVGSLPIAIRPYATTKEVLSLASYQPKTALSDGPAALEPLRSPANANESAKSISSSVALRKAVYAERDLSRSMDPGTLDFSMEQDGDDAESIDELPGGEGDHGERGRLKALKILEARSKIPAAGMWRSLA